MSSLPEKLDSLIRKAKTMASRVNLLKEQSDKQLKEIEKLKIELEKERFEVQNLNSKLKTLKLAQILEASSADKTELKRKINEYLKKIDSCIGALND